MRSSGFGLRSEQSELKTMDEILYCHAEKDTAMVDAGDWFFHTGNWTLCAQASEAGDGRWTLDLHSQSWGKPLAQPKQQFSSIDELKAFLADYFEVPVVQVDCSDFPAPDEL